MQISPMVRVSGRRIADMVVGAIEGGSNHWLRRFRLESASIPPVARPWYDDEHLWDGTFSIKAVWDNGTKNITQDDVKAGLDVMSAVYPKHFAELASENDDADTADVFMQCVLFRETVYC